MGDRRLACLVALVNYGQKCLNILYLNREKRGNSMDISVVNLGLNDVKADALVIPVFEDVECDRLEVKEFYNYAKDNQGLSAKFSEIIVLPTYDKLSAKNIIFLGLGKKEEFSLNKLRVVASKVAQKAQAMKKTTVVAFCLDGLFESICSVAKNVVEGALIGTYKFDKYKSEKKEDETNNKE